MAAYSGGFVLRNWLFKIGSTDYTNQTTGVELNPDQNVQTLRTGVPDGAIQDVDSAVWTIKLKGVQDYESGGLAAALSASAGNTGTFTYAPVNTTGKKSWTGTFRYVAPIVGGDQGKFADFELELPVIGTPSASTV